MKVQVLLPKIFNLPFTYNADNNKKYKKGDLVQIPFGNKKELGVIWNDIAHAPKKITIKNIDKKVINFALNQTLIDFIDWFAMYNMVPRGLALKMCIGNGKNLYKDTDEYEFKKKIEIINYSLNQEQKKL